MTKKRWGELKFGKSEPRTIAPENVAKKLRAALPEVLDKLMDRAVRQDESIRLTEIKLRDYERQIRDLEKQNEKLMGVVTAAKKLRPTYSFDGVVEKYSPGDGEDYFVNFKRMQKLLDALKELKKAENK
jgi:transcriptional regulatory protein LevR